MTGTSTQGCCIASGEDKNEITHILNTHYYLGDIFHYTIGPVDMWLGIQAIIMNILVISFYYKKYEKIVPFMYLLIAACDLFTGITAMLNAFTFLLLETKTNTALYLIFPANVISSITFKVSVFLNLMIVTIRTINIYKPLYHISIAVVETVIITWFMVIGRC